MAGILTHFFFALMILVNGVSCVYMQAKNDTSNQGNRSSERKISDANKISNKKNENMKDIFNVNETVEKSFPVSGVATVKIFSFEGEITVKSENTSTVKMRATKMAVDKDASDGVKYNFSRQNDTISLEADYSKPDRKVTYGKTYFYTKGAYVNWELIVPAETNLILETGEGKLSVEGISGDIKLTTKDGSITATDCRGNLETTTLDGKIQIKGHEGNAGIVNRGDDPVLVEGSFQNLSIETGGGNVFLGLPKSTGGTIESDDNNISAKYFVLKQSGQNDEGWPKFSFGTGNSTIKIQANTGRISIYSL